MLDDVYREYYLATEEAYDLGCTANVTPDEWQASHERMDAAVKACEKSEKNLRHWEAFKNIMENAEFKSNQMLEEQKDMF